MARKEKNDVSVSAFTVNIDIPKDGPERLIANAELVLPDPFAGLKLVGFSIWKGVDGERFVTFPSRAFGAGADRRFYDFLRPVSGDSKEPVRLLKDLILQAHDKLQASQPTTTAEA